MDKRRKRNLVAWFEVLVTGMAQDGFSKVHIFRLHIMGRAQTFVFSLLSIYTLGLGIALAMSP